MVAWFISGGVRLAGRLPVRGALKGRPATTAVIGAKSVFTAQYDPCTVYRHLAVTHLRVWTAQAGIRPRHFLETDQFDIFRRLRLPRRQIRDGLLYQGIAACLSHNDARLRMHWLLSHNDARR